MHCDDHFRLDEILAMTPPELQLALDGDLSKPSPFAETVFKTPAEREEYIAWRRGLTVKDRLELALEKWY